MFNFKIAHSLLFAGCLAVSNLAYATVPTIYNFGSLLTASTGYTAPNNFAANPFAQLQATNNGGGVWAFMLTINNNLFSSFGPSAFLGTMTFDFTPDPVNKNLVTAFVASNGVATATGTGGTGNSGLLDVDFGTKFGQGKDKLVQNEWVKWTVSGLGNSNLTNMYVHVQGITGGYSAKYTPVTPIPEPETYAMLLAGLGLLGFAARRRVHNV